MAQNFYSLDVTKDVKTVIPQMQTSLESVASNFSGEVFPTANLFIGMKCYRTDLKNTYKWDGTDWLLDSPPFATDDEAKAGTVDDKIMSPARVKTAVDSVIDTIKGGTNGIATLDSTGKIPTAQIPQLDYAETADKLKTARKIGGVSFDGSIDIDLPGVNKIGTQDTSGTAATATLANKFATRTDNITSTTDDTPANWAAKGPGTWFYGTAGQLNGQPVQWGHLFNMVNGTSECSQIWVNSNSADVYVRGGNQNGWLHEWSSITTTAFVNGTTGFQRYASGVLEIWGEVTMNLAEWTSRWISFPLAFSSIPNVEVCLAENTPHNEYTTLFVYNRSTTGFNVMKQCSETNIVITYRAIGKGE